MRRVGSVVIGVALAAMLVAAAPALGEEPRPCGQQGLRCLTVEVPLDYASPETATLGLKVTTLPGVSGRGALVVLTGGPGQAGLATAAGPEAMRAMRRLAGGRTIVSVDQRGTGSTALRCAVIDRPGLAAPADVGSAAAVGAACARQVGLRRTQFTTGQTVQDLERIRTTLGLERWSVGGVSYGTFVATSYARTYPARTERLLLDSTLRLEGSAAVDVDPFTAGRRIVGRLCSGGRCPGVRGLGTQTARLSRVLARRALPAVSVGPDGRPARTAFGGPRDPSALIDTLQNGDLSPAARAAFPAGVVAALRGDASLLARAGEAGGGGTDDAREFSTALFLTTSCEETLVPWTTAEDAAARRAALRAAVGGVPARDLAPFGASQAVGYGAWSVCFGWPEADLYRPPAGGIPESIPTLILSGADDVRTPTEAARAVVAQSPSASLVVVPHRGHSLITQGEECVEDAGRRFFAGSRVPAGICSDVEPLVDPYPVPPRTLGSLTPARGYSGRVGRTLTALARTLDDIDPSLQLAPDQEGDVVHTTGLRAGRLIVDFRPTEVRGLLRAFTYVPGVSVTGDLRFGFLGATSRSIRVSGSAAARGKLTLAPGGILTGTLAGTPIRARITDSGVRRLSA